jgi:glycerol-3-phosphate dehydrogenase (NAD(P)+)
VTTRRSRVLILGYGEMGQSMAHLLHRRHDVRVWQRRPPSHVGAVDFDCVAHESDFILFCVPTQPHAALAARLRPSLRSDAICLTVAKGLDDVGRPAAAILRAVFGDLPYAVLHGPMIAEELRADRPGFAQVASEHKDVSFRVQGLFADTLLFLSPSSDPVGLGWAAVLKNIYAIAFGMADGLRLGDNVRGHLTVAALREMAGIVEDVGGQRSAVGALAGLGDLVTTATSAGSSHHELGQRLVTEPHPDVQGEGAHSLERIRALGLFDIDRYPLCSFVEASLRAGARRQDFLRYLARACDVCECD